MLRAITPGAEDTAEAPDSGSRIVERTQRVLRALEAEQGRLRRAVTPAEVAAKAGLPNATTCRYLQNLVAAGSVRRPGGKTRGSYLLNDVTPPYRALPYPSQGLRRALVTLQARTGQPALLYFPFDLAEQRLRICVDEQWGMVDSSGKEVLEVAPLGIDPPGLVIAAALKNTGVPDSALRAIQSHGYAIGPSLVDGLDAIAAPIWRGSAPAGAVTLMPAQWQMQSTKSQADLIRAVMEAAGTMSGHLTRLPATRAA